MVRIRQLAALLLCLAAGAAHAWWDPAWAQRTKIVVDTGAQGVPTTEALQQVPLALRLHSGNFDFVGARPDGSDLRLVAGDDKTPLPFRIERWDSVNELALVWVLLPAVAPNAQTVLYAYAGNDQAPPVADARATGLDAATQVALHFAETGDEPRPATPPALQPNGLLGASLRLDGKPVEVPLAQRLAAEGALSLSLWVQPTAVERGTLLQWGPLALALDGARWSARVGGVALGGGSAAAGKWAHVALTVGGGQAALWVDGAQVAQGAAALPAVEGPLRLGEGVTGLMDEVQVASAVRPAAWLALAAATQGIGNRGLATTLEHAGETGGGDGGGGYIGILVQNLTLDAWVVIVILAVMMVVAVWVMVAKTLQVRRADRANRGFLRQFRDAGADLLAIGGEQHAHSSLYRLYAAGVRELAKRDVGRSDRALSGASLDAVKASIDADLVRENHRLNDQMVLLTIAISGGPFLGLLGTVVGVMITFAAIAAAGDVNVNAIAPGIAAALLATVAGLGVAIPALFGYNYLASRIKNISADMQIFVDEFVTRVAERYGAR